MQFPVTLLLSAALANAAALNFLTWTCTTCVDSNTCRQTNYPGNIVNTCLPLRTDSTSIPVRGVKLFGTQDCPQGRLELYDAAGCSGTPVAYTLENPLPGTGPTCHNESGLVTKRYYKVVC